MVWVGNSVGEIVELDVRSGETGPPRADAAGSRRAIVKMYRFQNAVWSLDEDGRLVVWRPSGDQGVPSLHGSHPAVHRVARGHTFSMIVGGLLWHATGRELRIYNPLGSEKSFYVTTNALGQPNLSGVSAGALLTNQPDRVYFGHIDGNVSMYSTAVPYACVGVVKASDYKINCLGGAGAYLWAGFNTGTVAVYDTRTRPWKLKKDWPAHQGSVFGMAVDRSSVWKLGGLQVATIGQDNAIRFWDGMLEDDFQEAYMQERDVEYCSFDEITAVVVTWNVGASTPAGLRCDERDENFFRDVIRPAQDPPPDIIVFGFQELVDLEDKKQMGKSLFKNSSKKDAAESDMSHQYRAWRDYLVGALDAHMPTDRPYDLLHTSSLVGLFTCCFVRSAIRGRVRKAAGAEVRRDKLRLGYKGGLLLRFLVDDTSVCLANCHLAAGQSETRHRNEDAAAILEAAELPPLFGAPASVDAVPSTPDRLDALAGGGDGRQVLDHAVVLLAGDLNYRVDAMPRAAVLRAVAAGQLARLRERDQLRVARRRYPDLRLRAFAEPPCDFAPTYKYDVGTDRYDTSDKGRAPAWCDRVLYRGLGRVKALEYRRWEVRRSDHRPVSAVFRARVKKVDKGRREGVWEACERETVRMRQALAMEAQ